MAEQQQQGNQRDMGTLMDAALMALTANALPCKQDDLLPEKLHRTLGETFSEIPTIDLNNVAFINLPGTILRKKPDALVALLRGHGITDEEKLSEIRDALRSVVDHDRATRNGQIGDRYPMAFIRAGTPIGVMATPMDDVVGGVIHSIATFVPVNQEPLMQHAYYRQLVTILYVKAMKRQPISLTFCYEVSEEGKMHLFLASYR